MFEEFVLGNEVLLRSISRTLAKPRYDFGLGMV
jgi:hypothetical protein